MTIPNTIDTFVDKASARTKALTKVNELMAEVSLVQKRHAQAMLDGEPALAEAEELRSSKMKALDEEYAINRQAVEEEALNARNNVKSNCGTQAAELKKVLKKYNEAQHQLLKLLPTPNTLTEELEDVQQKAQVATAS